MRKSDREEILRRLAMGSDFDSDRNKRKSNLQSRLVSGMNMQVCFVNEATSDSESNSDTEYMNSPIRNKLGSRSTSKLYSKCKTKEDNSEKCKKTEQPVDEFTEKQMRLKFEARMALAQAQKMARMQIEIERHKNKLSPVTEIVKASCRDVIDSSLIENRRRITRPILSKLTLHQLNAISNDLSAQIDKLNGDLMKQLVERDDLHMEQDSMLVDIEDLSYKYNQLQAKYNRNTAHTRSEPSPADMNNKNSVVSLIAPALLTSKLAKYTFKSQSLFNIAAIVKK